MSNTVLLVDDSPTVRRQVAAVLAHEGFPIIEASDGVEALRMLDAGAVGLVICDLNMPGMSGLDVLARAKADPRHAALPFLMLTTSGNPALVARARQGGAKAWAVKPLQPERLVATVKRLLGRS